MSEARPCCNSKCEVDNRLIPHHHDHSLDMAPRLKPFLANIFVKKSSNVHVGHTFVRVTQNIENIEVTQGRILGLELVTPQNSRQQRSTTVCVCWSLLVATVLVFFIFYFALAKDIQRLELDIQQPWYISRPYWYANPATYMTLLNLPVSKVIIGHSVDTQDYCTEKYDCIQIVFELQKVHQADVRWSDIAANFLVSGNGLVFEGRGANIEGSMVRSLDDQSISIMFLGNYVVNRPCDEQFHHVKLLLQELVTKGVLTEDYEVFGHCQVIGSIVPPGPHIMDKLDNFPHWNPRNVSACLRSL